MRLYMAEAITLAREGVRRGDGGPFGAVVVRKGEILGRGWNCVIRDRDPTAHAEIVAIRDAARRLGHHHLDGCALYVACEPCPMCLSAVYWARIERVYYAASGTDAAALGFDDRFILDELRRAAAVRRIPMEQLMRDEALTVFEAWRRSELREDY